MRTHAAIVIAALWIVSIAFAISTTPVTAWHTTEVSIDEDLLKGNLPMVFTITVTNNGPAVIDNVRIIVPDGFSATGIAPLKKILKDNLVRTHEDSEVVLPAGTVVQLLEDRTVTLAENTDVILLKDKWLWVPVIGENTRLNENALIETKAPGVTADNIGNLENIEVTRITVVLDDENQLRLLADTSVVWVADNIVRVPENTLMELWAANDNTLYFGENVKTTRDVTVTLSDNAMRMVTDKPSNLKGFDIPTGENIEIHENEVVVIQTGTTVALAGDVLVQIAENTDVIRVANKKLIYDNENATVEDMPANWTPDNGTTGLPPGDYVGFENDVGIAIGASLDFPFSMTTSAAGGAYTIYVKTTDLWFGTTTNTITLTIDNAPPTVKIEPSPSWVKENTEVTITITATETLAKLDNVMVEESNAPENTQVSMTPNADNTVWTGTYMTSDNTQRDGTAKIYVSQFADWVGNQGAPTDNTFTVDRADPPTPKITDITGFPADSTWPVTTPSPAIETKWDTATLEAVAQDNLAGTIGPQAGMTVKIRVGDTVHSLTTPATGYWSQFITLSEGVQEIGIQYIDKAGNEGTENVENVTLDSRKPSVSITSPADGAIIKDNTPLIQLTITDATLGVENEAYGSVRENAGYWVQLRRDNDNVQIGENLTPITPSTSDPFNSFTFENQRTTELADMWYNINVVAGDNLQRENTYFRFRVDTAPPSIRSSPISSDVALIGSTLATPTETFEDSVLIVSDAEAGATVEVLVNDAVEATVTAEDDEAWAASVPLVMGLNKIEARATDAAGNVSDTELYGYILRLAPDVTLPTVTITAPEADTTTDKASITVSGKATDDVDDYTELSVGLDSTGAFVLKTVFLNTDGSFSTTVPLAEGSNVISVIATDTSGNQKIASVTVTRTVTPWGIYAIVIVIVALALAVIAIFRKR